MALIKCSDCGRMLSDKARVCPHCGAPVLSSTQQSFSEGESTRVQAGGMQPAGGYNKPVGNGGKKPNSNVILIALLSIIFLLILVLFIMLFKGCGGSSEKSEVAKLQAEVDAANRELENAKNGSNSDQQTEQARLEAERARLAEERAQLEALQQAEAARKRAEAEAARLRSVTGVYTGKLYGVNARLSLNQSGTSVSGSYTGNTRRYSVSGTADNDGNFDIYISNAELTDAHVSGSVNGYTMSGVWEEYLTGEVYNFTLKRH